jgi:hypothetical protein
MPSLLKWKLDHYSPFSSSDEENMDHYSPFSPFRSSDEEENPAATIPANIDMHMTPIAPDIHTADSDFCDRPVWACDLADIDMTPIAPDIDTADLDLRDGPAEATTPAYIDTPIAPDIDTADLDLCDWPAENDVLEMAVDSGKLVRRMLPNTQVRTPHGVQCHCESMIFQIVAENGGANMCIFKVARICLV